MHLLQAVRRSRRNLRWKAQVSATYNGSKSHAYAIQQSASTTTSVCSTTTNRYHMVRYASFPPSSLIARNTEHVGPNVSALRSEPDKAYLSNASGTKTRSILVARNPAEFSYNVRCILEKLPSLPLSRKETKQCRTKEVLDY